MTEITEERVRALREQMDDSMFMCDGGCAPDECVCVSMDMLNLFDGLSEAYLSKCAEVRELRDRLQLQPIETAPQDAWFLAYEDGAMYKCKLDEIDIDGTALWLSDCGQYVCESPNPSHWMPLPEAPTHD